MGSFRSLPLPRNEEDLIIQQPFRNPRNEFSVDQVRRFPRVVLREVEAQAPIPVEMDFRRFHQGGGQDVHGRHREGIVPNLDVVGVAVFFRRDFTVANQFIRSMHSASKTVEVAFDSQFLSDAPPVEVRPVSTDFTHGLRRIDAAGW